MEFRSLSQAEAKVVLTLEADGTEVVALDRIRRLAGISPGYARKLAHDLVRKGWLQRVRSGTYLLNPSDRGPDALPDLDPFRVGSHLVEPYYFGYATAAELHGFFPQASRTYYLVTTTRSAPPRSLRDRFRFVRVRPARYFGTTAVTRRKQRLIVSDPERTFVDCLSRPEFAGGISGIAQIVSLAKPRIDWKRLGSYLTRLGDRSLALRAGYLAERIRPSLPPPTQWLRDHLPGAGDPYVPLVRAAAHGRAGTRDERWHILRNVSDAALFAEGEVP